jgi:hypothetical protein
MNGQIWLSKVFLEKKLFFIIEKKQEGKKIEIIWKIKKGSFCSQTQKKNIYTTYVGLWPSLHFQTLCSHLGIRLQKKDLNLLTMTLIILFVKKLGVKTLLKQTMF